ncbi:MAG: hypothetical protein EP329_14565 [Deltaproteobacteria bacterium]|nr:MAG: hypothetical protein EP329_14565 [Deltaproteobacteria bacterium]
MRWGAVLWAAVALSAGCTDADRALTGRWGATEPVESSWLVGRPELAIGHYGSELTGVAWFLDGDGIASPVCPCAYVDQLSLDLGAEEFAASTDFCTGDKWIWRLALDDTHDPPHLVGTVEVKDAPSTLLDIELERIDTFIPDERKLCDR